ncbi:MAG: proprotein convertase P-domain-containing protein, partial [Deltaproteobacteria bacterium]|nr:proprotein convertase P-domain-containing protein [Deltaproteobacteria bacterium]
VETDSTFNLDSWTIDRFKIKASLKPEITGGITDIVIGINESLKKTYKAADVDHFTAPYTQTPKFSFFGCPYDSITFAEIDPIFFKDMQGNFYVSITYDPKGNEDLAGGYKVGLLIKEGGPEDVKTVQLESLHTFNITVLLNSGYLVWSPKGSSLTTAVELKNALKDNGRKAQILQDLSVYNDLSVLDGIFVTLGVYGSNHVMTAAQGNALKGYLDGGGKVYLEGGDFWFADPPTALHSYFNVEATADGSIKLDGPVNGYNFLYGYNYNYSQSLTLNNFIDRIKNKVGTDSRIIQRNMGTKQFGTAVANQGAGYRTIGASTLFAGYIEQPGGMTKKDLMAKDIYFLENGWPPCTNDNQCDDLDVCTADSCNAPFCSNAQVADCVPCSDDSVCPLTKACNLNLGYCVPIPGNMFTSTDVPKSFGSNPSLIYSTQNIPTNGKITDIYLKVQVDHNYRGDVKLKLAHAGKEVNLKSNNPADSGDNVYATYDIVPSVDPMTTFDNGTLQGIWTLTVEDKDPLLNNGILKNWWVFSVYEQQPCATPADCNDGNFCTDEDCVNNFCVWTEHNCDDSDPSTIDSCDLATGQCVHETISNCPSCDCLYHFDCGYNDVCLEEVAQVVCNPANPQNCKCYPIAGTPYYLTSGVPVAIPDNDNNGVTVTRTITTGESTGVVRDLNVKFNTAHQFMGDLRAILCRGAVCVTMHNKSGGMVGGFYKVFDYDDLDGPGAILDFKGLKLAGAWSFKVIDNVAGNTGFFKDGTLYITETQCYKNSDCDDGNVCTTDLCSVSGDVGTCSNVELPCAPNPHPCKYNQCNPATGTCQEYNKTNGSACDDNLFCTVDDSCNNTVCGGVPKDCSYLGDQCLNGVCSEENKMCVYAPKTDGTTCEDGDICTGGDQCIGGVCQTGTTPVCTCVNDFDCQDDGDKCNGTQWFCNANKKCQLLDTPVQCPAPPDQCKRYQCIPLTGNCVLYNQLNGFPCNDGQFCTVADTCQAGVCSSGGARDCSVETDQCNTGVCNETSDSCVKSPVADNTICEKDGLGCTIDKCTTGG